MLENIVEIFKKMIGDKKEYKDMMARVKALPEDYQFVYEKIQKYTWHYVIGDGFDILKVQYDLIDLFESGVAEGKKVLEITGEDVASFSDELLSTAKTNTTNLRDTLNHDIMKKLKK